MPADRSKWPWLVRVILWGVPSRGAAWACFWLSLVIACICAIVGFARPIVSVGVLVSLAAPGYYRAIRWVDQHGDW